MKQSAGILVYRQIEGRLQVLLVHPGGPFWAKKDEGAWTIPKGEIEPGEDPLTAARREVVEEIGYVPDGEAIALAPVKQPSGKLVHAFALRGELDVSRITSNTFTMEWPPKSGKMTEFPEVDRAGWFSLEEARGKILKGQLAFLTQLVELLERR